MIDVSRNPRFLVFIVPVLVLFSLFFLYLYALLDFTLFQYQSLLVLKHFQPGLMLDGQSAADSLNLVPLLGLIGSGLIEALQYLSGRLAGMSFRVADINDLIMNTAGAGAGCLLALVSFRLARKLAREDRFRGHPVITYLANLGRLPRPGPRT